MILEPGSKLSEKLQNNIKIVLAGVVFELLIKQITHEPLAN